MECLPTHTLLDHIHIIINLEPMFKIFKSPTSLINLASSSFLFFFPVFGIGFLESKEMKRLRSSDDLESSYSDKITGKDSSSNPNPNRAVLSSSSSHRGFYYKSDNGRKSLVSPSSSSSRYDRDRSLEDDNRIVRKRPDHDFESFDRRKSGFDRYNNRDGSGSDRGVHRSESFSGSRREFPKGVRSERDRTRREGSVSSWRRFGSERKDFGVERKEFGGGHKEFEEINKGGSGRDERVGGGSGKALRDLMKSPSWSRDSGSEQSRARGLGDSRSKSKSKSRSSPTWSKDSVGSEQTKSLEVAKKSVEVKIESGGGSSSSSEMEEGELEPEVGCEGENGLAADEAGNGNEVKESDTRVDGDDDKEVEDVGKVVEDEKEGNKENVSEAKNDGLEEVGELPEGENLNVESSDSRDEKGNVCAEEGDKEQEEVFGDRSSDDKEEGNKDSVDEKSLEEESKEEKGIDLEYKAEEEIEVLESNMDQTAEDNGGGEVNVHMEMEGLSRNFKDKGKGVAVTPTHDADSAENSVWVERESRVTASWKADDMEGPSSRGFELFTSSPVRKTEAKAEPGVNNKDKDDKMAMESLDLSLSLPNILLPIGARDATQAPGSPSHGRSVSMTNTFCTNSDGFTASMSFSGSQSFFHNPSCSLTGQNSMDNFEQSVHSHPIFKGVDWQGLSQNESSRHKEIPLYQRILMNGNGSIHQSQTSLQGIPNGQVAQGQHVRVAEGSTKTPNGLDRQLSFNKQNDVRSPTHSAGSHEIGSSYSFEKKRPMREKQGGVRLYRSSSQKEQEEHPMGGAEFVETVIGRIVSDPIHVMARKFHEMTAQSMVSLKNSIHDIILNPDKKAQLCAYQNALQRRSDINMEVLLKSHPAQLVILVALKTGILEYLQPNSSNSSTDLAEIFLNLRCRNLTCRSPLPVDECDCKVCAKKDGFCSGCMCLVCSKFDMASNTCSWVGCDVCLHWCHADCALRESFIRNGRSATGAQGLTEMQFHCVACDHPSEMFGFVKEVFLNFAKEWSAETMSRELEYVKRIFRGSKDLRGKRLHEIAGQMLVRLSNKSDFSEVLNHIVGFLTDSESSKFSNSLVFSEKEQVKGSNRIVAGPSHDNPMWLKSVYSDKSPQLERSASLLPSIHVDQNQNDKLPSMESEMHRSAQKEPPLFDELESIVRIKQAEAKMFQARADDARREAEGLKRIAITKNEKIEEEYNSRISKLRLVEAEEMRKQKLEEFQGLERAYREYFTMKMRMENDIKDLLMKMETTRRNLAL
ncbi:hypothetical protein Q3G72_008556 [Acer saccharum]|nr:hypothetical protein Q3G72_008556 [Acer saccharum]